MGIRSNSNTKNQLGRESSQLLTLVPTPEKRTASGEQLGFRTTHPKKPCFVDLRPFAWGQENPKRKSSNNLWRGAFSGRQELLNELTPAIIDKLSPLAEPTVIKYVEYLREWWRLFDQVEAQTPELSRVTSVAQINDLHRQIAIDQGMHQDKFKVLLSLVNTARAAIGLKQLHWRSPERGKPTRHLPPQWQCELVRRTLKRRWFEVLDRWALAEELRMQGSPLVQKQDAPAVYAEQERLVRNYRRFDAVVNKVGHPRPSGDALYDDLTFQAFNHRGYNVAEMLAGKYPDGNDIRTAFHLCLATTGWNPAVLLSLDVSKPFIEVHPRDDKRYVLRGTKERAGGTEQVSEGLFKTQGSAGVVLQTLIERTAPLREQLRQELETCKALLKQTNNSTEELYQRITVLEQGVRSPWIYAPKWGETPIAFLTDSDFSAVRENGIRVGYMRKLTNELNMHRPADKQLSPMKAGDLRDAYAAYVYGASGGSILAVMKALGHRKVDTTQIYLHNTLLLEEHRKLFGTFTDALWDEMLSNGRVDPTILAKLSRDGEITHAQRERLKTYRTLMLSRIGVACKDPCNPPKHIAPNFEVDGKNHCHVQRCTLCLEHAVILPESLDGLCKRLAELRYLRGRMGIGAFEESSYVQEMSNTEIALLAFDEGKVQEHFDVWEAQIENGEHRFMEFDGIAFKAIK